MNKFKYQITIPAQTQREADDKMKALVQIVNKLSAIELIKITEVINNPIQLSIIKTKLGL
jgi:hypothetical protein